MNNKHRFLPRLYSHYLEKRAYDTHKKRIEQIRNTDPLTRIKEIQERHQQKAANSTSKVKVESYGKVKLSPRAKKAKRERQIQNVRLLDRIQNCCSSIVSKREIDQSNAKNQYLKQRMSKFVFISRSQQILLKCSHSLSKLEQKEKQKSKDQKRGITRQSRPRYAKTELQQQEKQQYTNDLLNKQGSLDIRDNLRSSKNFSKAMFKNYSKQKLQNLKDSLWNEPNRKKKKTRRKKKSTSVALV